MEKLQNITMFLSVLKIEFFYSVIFHSLNLSLQRMSSTTYVVTLHFYNDSDIIRYTNCTSTEEYVGVELRKVLIAKAKTEFPAKHTNTVNLHYVESQDGYKLVNITQMHNVLGMTVEQEQAKLAFEERKSKRFAGGFDIIDYAKQLKNSTAN